MCGIIGIISKNNDVPLKLYEGLCHLQHRGQDSAGICNETTNIKKDGLVKDVFEERDLTSLMSNIGMGHVRYGTTGGFEDKAIQPLVESVNATRISMCHNGNVTPVTKIGKQFHSDSEYLLDLFCELYEEREIITPTYKVIFEICDKMMNTVKGSYSVIILIEGFGLVSFRDPFGVRPLCYGVQDNDFLIASESLAIDILNFQFIRDVHPGEVIVIEHNQLPRFFQHSHSHLYPCLFEYFYFSRDDSIVDGINVYDSRFNMGKLLGEKIKSMNINDIDMIIPVPDSSFVFALGVQECLKILIKKGLVRNNYVDRTFIMKNNQIIQKNIRRKLNAVKSVMQNKNILIIDDSIVRGNTSSYIVNLVKKAGANKVYFGSGAPPILYPNKYGIYIPDRNDLIAVDRTSQDIADILGCNKVIFNDLSNVIHCLRAMNPTVEGFETSMFNNHHLFM